MTGPPGGEQLGDARLEPEVVATPPARVVEALLDVDDEEGGLGEDGGAHGPGLSDAGPRTKTAILRIGGGDGMKEEVKTELELRHLRAFVAVVETGGHTRAARSLRV